MTRARRLAALLPLVALLVGALIGPRPAVLAAAGDGQYQQGVAAARSGHYAAAARDFEQAILHGHNDPDTFYQLGLAYSKLKRWDDAVWAIAMALGDPVFNATQPKAQSALDAAQNAGGANAGPPPLLQNVTVKPMKAPPASPAQMAVRESQAAFASFQDPTNVYYISPEFNKQISVRSAIPLTNAAADLANNSSTGVKFVYLGATPVPYTNLQQYAKDFFSRLKLQRAVLLVITPQASAAYSDRLDAATTARIVAQQRGLAAGDQVALAAGIARAVTRQADDNDSAAARRAVAIGVSILAIVLVAVGIGIWRVARAATPGSRRRPTGRPRAAVRPRPQ